MADLTSFLLEQADKRKARFSAERPEYEVAEERSEAIADFSEPVTHFMERVTGLKRAYFGSWIPGIPLATLLSAGRTLSVDIAPQHLSAFRSSYGISEKALKEFARRGMLVLNIRDFDPRSSNPDEQAANYAAYEGLLMELFEVAPNSIYFLADIRDQIFDSIPGLSSSKQSLRALQAEAKAYLEDAARDAAKLKDFDQVVVETVFRGERSSLVAASWHWAYIKSMERIVPSAFQEHLRGAWDRCGKPEGGTSKGYEFLRLARLLRYAHLLYSAPLSASFGGVYNFALDREYYYIRAFEQEQTMYEYDFARDELIDFIYDLQVGRISRNFEPFLDGRYWSELSQFGIDCFVRAGSASHFDHYDLDENIEELSAYFQEVTEETRFSALNRELDALVSNADKGAIRPRRLVEIAADFARMRAEKSNMLSRHTEGHQLIRGASAENFERFPSAVNETDPRATNLTFGLLRSEGLETNLNSRVGGAGDIGRRIVHFLRRLRLPPT